MSANSILCPTNKEVTILRSLAEHMRSIADSEDMVLKRRAWKNLQDLHAERPMVLFETYFIENYIKEEELQCANPVLRNIEKYMTHQIRHYQTVNDDIVWDPYLNIGWEISDTGYGVDLSEKHVENSMAYVFDSPIQEPDDIKKLKHKEFIVDRDFSYALLDVLDSIFGDILPIKLGNCDSVFHQRGYYPFCGCNGIYLTMDVFKLIGNMNLMLWPFDYPDELHEILEFVTQDRINMFKWMEKEKLLVANTDSQFAGPFGYGYVSDLQESFVNQNASLKDCWNWAESQETVTMSPDMFEEFFLPYIARVANLFGHTYYGCCETIDDRIDRILKAIPNIRTVSVSAWNNFEKVADILGKKYVYCRKPNPAHISGSDPDWDAGEKDVLNTWLYTKDSNVEFVLRDIYDDGNDNNRGKDWVTMVKRVLGM